MRGSGALDDEDGFVVDEGFVAVEAKEVVLLDGVAQEGFADVFCGLVVVLLEDSFERGAGLGVAAVVDSVGVEDEDVPGIDEGDLGDVIGGDAPLAQVHREVASAIRMIGGELEAESEELRHVVFMDVEQPGAFRRVDQRRWVAEVCEAKVSSGVDFAIQHGGNLSRLFCFAHTEGVASGDGLRHAQVQVFEEPGGSFSVAVELGEHEGLEGVVNGGGNLCGDDAVALGVDDQNTGG